MEFKSDKAKKAAERYIRLTFPHGCPPKQGIDIKLAFYAGMFDMYVQMQEVACSDEVVAVSELEELVSEVKGRALKLNEERRGI